MVDAEMTESWVSGNEWRRDEEIAVQVLDVVRRRLLLVPITFSPHALERQQRLTEPLQISQFLVGCAYERCSGPFVYSYRLVIYM
jgi:hypothetical protein